MTQEEIDERSECQSLLVDCSDYLDMQDETALLGTIDAIVVQITQGDREQRVEETPTERRARELNEYHQCVFDKYMKEVIYIFYDIFGY